MRVAYNALSLHPGLSDGAASVTLNLLKQLPSALDADLVVYARSDEERIGGGLHVVRLPVAGRARRVAMETFWLGRAVKGAGADVFFSPHESVPLRLPCPLVVLAQNLVYHCGIDEYTGSNWRERMSTHLQAAYYRARMSNTYERAAAVIAVSQFAADLLAERSRLSRGKTTVVHLGSDSVAIPDGAQTARGNELLIVSTLAPYKNIDRALALFARLRAERPELRLSIVGGDWRGYRRVLEAEAASLGVASAVDFVGPAAPATMADHYRRATVLLHLSSCEACPLPLLEAMRFGLPLVVADRVSLPELAGPAGLLVDPDDVDGAAAAVLALLRSPERLAELGRQGRERAAELTWRRAAEEIARVLVQAAR